MIRVTEEAMLKAGTPMFIIRVRVSAAGLRLFKPVGCKECSGGYRGRVGIYEIMLMSDNIAKLIMQGANSLQIAAIAQKEGMRTLRISGLEKARLGVTSLAEINRITTN